LEDQWPEKIRIPDKLYFKISEAAVLAGLPTSVLRFWETKFTTLKPKRTPSGRRLYRKKDIALIFEIKHLIYDQKFTTEGAKQQLKNCTRADDKNKLVGKLAEIRKELESIRDILAIILLSVFSSNVFQSGFQSSSCCVSGQRIYDFIEMIFSKFG
jgi:DNA-binding transcriptional MerR regulator